jgi:hypothetical protein
MPGTDARSQSYPSELAFTGGCEVSLERAVVPYRSPDDRALPGGRSSDLGVGVVLEGPREGRVEVLDLGSGLVRSAELSLPLVVFGWIFTTPFRELRAQARRETEGRGGGLAARILSQVGYAPLTRPLFLRAAFRDVALDLDPHEGTAVRLTLPGGGVARAHLEYERGVLVFRTGRSVPNAALAAALPDAFPRRPLFQVLNGAGQGSAELHVHLPELPTLPELRSEIRRVRRGLLHLLARFDEVRYRTVSDTLDGFGARDLLAGVGTSDGGAARPVRERLVVPRVGGRPATGRVH